MRHTFGFPRTALVSLALIAAPALYADVTLRYKTEVKLNPGLPQQITEQAMKGLGNGVPRESSLQLKNGKGFSSFSAYTSICDFTKQVITLLDAKGERYATMPTKQLVDELVRAMPQQPEEAKAAMAAMKGHFGSKPVSRTATIQGVEGEEHEFEMSVDGPASPEIPAGPMMRMVMHVWTAKASEATRLPAIRELAGYNLFAIATMNPIGMMEKVFPQMPGFGENIAAMMKEMQSGTAVILRMRMEIYMPMIAALMKRMPAGSSPFGANFDADTPFMEMNKELIEISTAGIADSVFQIPQGYKSAPAADMVKDLLSKAQAGLY